MEHLSDIDVILLCQQQNEVAFEELYQRYYGFVYAQAKRMCNNDADAKDVCQYVFMDVFRNIYALKNPQMFKLWLSRITHSKCIYLFQHNRNEYYSHETLDLMANTQNKQPISQTIQELHYQEDLEVLHEILSTMKPKYQEVISMMYLQQLSLQEIADELQIPLGTVKTRAMTARKELRKKIEIYERNEGIKLNFKADTILPISLSLGASIKCWFKQNQTILRFCAVSVSTGAIFYVGATAVIPDLQKNIAVASTPQPLLKNEQYVNETTDFPKVQIDYKTYYTSKSAYYGLLKWAEIDTLPEKTSEECIHMKPLYDALKSTNSTYYQTLVDSGWSSLFEEKVTGS